MTYLQNVHIIIKTNALAVEWDPAKNILNQMKHGLGFEDAGQVFDRESECITYIDSRADYGEIRFITIGKLRERVVVIAHTNRGDIIRIIIISMRKANEREKKAYQKRLTSSGQHERREH